MKRVRFVQVGLLPLDPMLVIDTMRASAAPVGGTPRDSTLLCPSLPFSASFSASLLPCSHLSSGCASGQFFVAADDAAYLRDMWRPAGSYFLVEMDVTVATLAPVMVGTASQPWTSASGVWGTTVCGAQCAGDGGERYADFDVSYVDAFDGVAKSARLVANFSADGATMTWVNGTHFATANGAGAQLLLDVPWHRCELAPELCVGPVRYATLPHHDAPGMNLANTPHFEGSGHVTRAVSLLPSPFAHACSLGTHSSTSPQHLPLDSAGRSSSGCSRPTGGTSSRRRGPSSPRG